MVCQSYGYAYILPVCVIYMTRVLLACTGQAIRMVYDIIIFGVTGFSGGLMLDYFANNRWWFVFFCLSLSCCCRFCVYVFVLSSFVLSLAWFGLCYISVLWSCLNLPCLCVLSCLVLIRQSQGTHKKITIQ
jgi:hypothetical protein